MMQRFHCQQMLPEAWGTRWQLRRGPRCHVQVAARGAVRPEGGGLRRHALQRGDAGAAAAKLRGRQQHSVITRDGGLTGRGRPPRCGPCNACA